MKRKFSNAENQPMQTAEDIAKELIEKIFLANEDISIAENQINFHYEPRHKSLYISKGLGEEYCSCLCIVDNAKDKAELLQTLQNWKAEALAKELEETYDELAPQNISFNKVEAGYVIGFDLSSGKDRSGGY